MTEAADEAGRPAFKLIAPDGHQYIIHANGMTEGFPEGGLVVNRIPVLLAQERARWRDALPVSAIEDIDPLGR